MSYTDGWLPGFEQVYNPRTGGTYDPEGEGYPWRFVGHSTESRNMPDVANHPYPPQLWLCYETGQKIQTINLLRSAYALWQSPTAPYYTNRARAVQCEFVGYAEESSSWSDDKLHWFAENAIVEFVRFVRVQGSDVDLVTVPPLGVVSMSATADAPQRLDPRVWAFGPIGYVTHRNVPMGDDHWDMMAPPEKMLRFARQILGEAPDSTIPVPTQPRRKRANMEFALRKRPSGQIVEDGPSFGFTGPVNYWDFPLVPAGCKVSVTGVYPEIPAFNAVVILANQADSVQAPQAVQWGSPSQTVVKSDSFCTVVVPAGFPCRVVAV